MRPRYESNSHRQAYSVIGNTPDFDSVFLGSSPSRPAFYNYTENPMIPYETWGFLCLEHVTDRH